MSDGSTRAAPGATNAKLRPLANYITDFLNFCRMEKGLASNSLEAYAGDLIRYEVYFGRRHGADFPRNHTDTVTGYLQSLYQSRLGSRSIARHLATLRNF